MDPDQFSWLLSKELQGTITAEERAALETAAGHDPELAMQRKLLLAFWQEQQDEQDNARTTQQAFGNLVNNIKNIDASQWPDSETDVTPVPVLHKRKWRLPLLKAAALLLLLAGITYITGQYLSQKQVASTHALASKHNGKGYRSRIVLTDGTTIWLNADSELQYPESFEGSPERKVFLTGEAFFEVAPDADKPFLIATSKMKIRVLGTSFNVRSYPEDVRHETTLISGAIEVILKDRPDAKIRLKPNEKLVIPNAPPDTLTGSPQTTPPTLLISQPTYYPDKDSVLIETAWIENRLIFRGERFEDLARQMERWYNVEIEFRNKELMQLSFTGMFRNEKLETALQALQLTEPFKYKIDKDHVIIY